MFKEHMIWIERLESLNSTFIFAPKIRFGPRAP